jgi:hypothetical protein
MDAGLLPHSSRIAAIIAVAAGKLARLRASHSGSADVTARLEAVERSLLLTGTVPKLSRWGGRLPPAASAEPLPLA